MIFQFAKLRGKKKKQIKIIIVEDQLQELTTDLCGIFQLYFYKILFKRLSDSKIINNEFLNCWLLNRSKLFCMKNVFLYRFYLEKK